MLLRLLRDLIGGWKPRAQADSLEELILRGTARRETGRLMEDFEDFTRAAELAPDDHRCLRQLAEVSYLVGDNRLALEYCARLRRVAPEHAADMLQAQIRFGGELYLQVLARILDAVKPRTYVEIGVARGDSLRLAKPPTLAIGVDPEPQLASPLAANHKVFAETSDAFFAARDPRAELGGLPIDLAFIDGMHHFEFALRDFANLERHSTPDSIILIHDCYPLDRETAQRERRRDFWSGDIWRLIVLLKKYRPELAVHTIATAPTGLGLVRNLDPGSRFLLEHYDRLYAEFLSLDYAYLDDDMGGKLNLFPNDWARIRTLLGSGAAAR